MLFFFSLFPLPFPSRRNIIKMKTAITAITIIKTKKTFTPFSHFIVYTNITKPERGYPALSGESRGFLAPKEGATNPWAEPFIVYAVLFFPGFASSGFFSGAAGAEEAETLRFVISQELSRVLGFTVPALALIGYLLALRGGKARLPGRPRSGDFLSLAVALPGLLGLGLLISLTASAVSSGPHALTVEAPRGLPAVAVMFFSCLSAGYLEEFYFRYYLSLRFKQAGMGEPFVIGLSVLLFSLCHIYEGLWGALNAFLAGILLSLVYKKYRALHGIAWAHGLYNAFIYLTGV
jgi:membrane protease YdiL (CAAX protease family)